MVTTYNTFTLGAVTYSLLPHPDNPDYLRLHAEDESGNLIAFAQIATTGEGGASIDLRATAGHPLTASVGDASGGLPYQGFA